MSLLIRFGGLIAGLGLADHAPNMSNQFIDLTAASDPTVILFQLAFLAIGFGVFFGGK